MNRKTLEYSLSKEIFNHLHSNPSLSHLTITIPPRKATIPFLYIISLLFHTSNEREEEPFFSEERRRGRGNPSNSAYQPEIRIQFFRADGFRLRPRATHSLYHHPHIPPLHPDTGCSLCRAIATKRNKTSRRHICNKLRGCLDNEERVERKTEKGEEVRGRGNV